MYIFRGSFPFRMHVLLTAISAVSRENDIMLDKQLSKCSALKFMILLNNFFI